MSNSLYPDQDRCSIGPDLCPNCLQKLSADGKSRRQQQKLIHALSYCLEDHEDPHVKVNI